MKPLNLMNFVDPKEKGKEKTTTRTNKKSKWEGWEPGVFEGPVEVLADLLEDRSADLRKGHLPVLRLRESTCAPTNRRQLISRSLSTSASDNRTIEREEEKAQEDERRKKKGEGEGSRPTWGSKHVADGLGDHGSLLVNDELEALGANQLHRLLVPRVLLPSLHPRDATTNVNPPLSRRLI